MKKLSDVLFIITNTIIYILYVLLFIKIVHLDIVLWAKILLGIIYGILGIDFCLMLSVVLFLIKKSIEELFNIC